MNNTMILFRTINQLVAEIRSNDPKTGITVYFVRTLVAEGKIKVRMASSKALINVDSFWEYMNENCNC